MTSGNRLHIRHGNATVSVCLRATEYNRRVGHIIANAKDAAFDDLIEAVQVAQTAYQQHLITGETQPQ